MIAAVPPQIELDTARSYGPRHLRFGWWLILALLPLGFLLGGIYTYGGDPGDGILLVPVGAVLLLVAVFVMAWSI